MKDNPEQARKRASAWYAANKERGKETRRAYYEANKEKLREQDRERKRAAREADPEGYAEKRRWEKIKSRRGMTQEQYYARLSEQGGVCAICEDAPPERGYLHIDHCHESTKVRGLLCPACNKGLGLFRDNPDALVRAARYLASATRPPSKRLFETSP